MGRRQCSGPNISLASIFLLAFWLFLFCGCCEGSPIRVMQESIGPSVVGSSGGALPRVAFRSKRTQSLVAPLNGVLQPASLQIICPDSSLNKMHTRYYVTPDYLKHPKRSNAASIIIRHFRVDNKAYVTFSDLEELNWLCVNKLGFLVKTIKKQNIAPRRCRFEPINVDQYPSIVQYESVLNKKPMRVIVPKSNETGAAEEQRVCDMFKVEVFKSYNVPPPQERTEAPAMQNKHSAPFRGLHFSPMDIVPFSSDSESKRNIVDGGVPAQPTPLTNRSGSTSVRSHSRLPPTQHQLHRRRHRKSHHVSRRTTPKLILSNKSS